MNTFHNGLKAWMHLCHHCVCPVSYLKYEFSIYIAKLWQSNRDVMAIGVSFWRRREFTRLHRGKIHPYPFIIIMMTSLNGNIFCITGLLWGKSTGHRWIPLTKASDAELWCFLWSAPQKRLSKQLRRRWFETPSRLSWRYCNVIWYQDHCLTDPVQMK